MKRLAVLILLMLFVFCACAESVNISESGDSSVDQNVSHVGSETEVSSAPPTEVFTDVSVSENKKNTVISNGASYAVSVDAAAEYPDAYLTELTDGFFDTSVTTYIHESFVGYATRSLNITVDLGDSYRDIHTFRAAYYIDNTAGISSELKISVYGSLDGKYWNKFGDLQPLTSKLQIVNLSELTMRKYVNARYIKFTVTGNDSWIFLQELSVIADTEDKTQQLYSDAVHNAYSELGTASFAPEGADVDRDLEKINVAKDKHYTIDTPRNKEYIDVDGKMLTDGIATGIYADKTWVGFDGGEDITVTIDLGETVNDIAVIEASFYVNNVLNIYLPTAITFSALDSSENSTELGVVYGSLDVTNGNFIFTLPFSKTVSTRYIEVVIHTIPNALHLMEEIGVYAYREDTDSGLYPPVVIEEGGEENPNGSDDYKNLILYKPHQINTSVGAMDFYKENNSPVTNRVMTDGEYSDDYNIHNGKFFKFYLGESRNIIYDLGYLSAVDKFTANFCHEEDWAMYAPDQVDVYVSPDGVNWYGIGSMLTSETETEGIYRCELVLDKKVIARYVVFSFDVSHWVGCDELQVYGTETITDAVSAESQGYKLISADISFNKRKEPSSDLLGGTRHLCLLYHNNSNRGYTASDLIPYLAYVDEEGNIIDTMFDSFLFLYSTGDMPSGNTAFSGSLKSDWQWCIDDLFSSGENLLALEEAAGQVKQALSLDDDFTYKVSMTVYYPTVANCENFGDIDGDGVNDDFADYETRIKALKWYIDEIEKRFYESDFKNIELVGYYWWHEDITSTSESDIKELLNDLSDIIHSKGKDMFWIPYFTAPGFSEWDEYGFDIACMQPNYVFHGERPYSNLINNEKFTRYYGMGVEMEIFEGCMSNTEYFKRYMQYVAVGAEYGYMTDTVDIKNPYEQLKESNSLIMYAKGDSRKNYLLAVAFSFCKM